MDSSVIAFLCGVAEGAAVIVIGVGIGFKMRKKAANEDVPKAFTTTWGGNVGGKTATLVPSKSGVGARVDKQQTVFTMTEERERDIEDGRDRLDEEDGAHD